MNQPLAKDYARLGELRELVTEAQQRLYSLQPLAAAEEAADVPPTPGSSQAAYRAALQRYVMLTHEQRAINCRMSKLRRGVPNPLPMPAPTPPLPPEGALVLALGSLPLPAPPRSCCPCLPARLPACSPGRACHHKEGSRQHEQKGVCSEQIGS
ncbi:hypothetical protein ABPG75_011097 [Micractinium tetrahymenae]